MRRDELRHGHATTGRGIATGRKEKAGNCWDLIGDGTESLGSDQLRMSKARTRVEMQWRSGGKLSEGKGEMCEASAA